MDKVSPNITHEVRQHLLGMGYAGIANYITPGLSSHLIGEGFHTSSKIRVFTNSRTQDMPITPHSHRFDLACMVLHGGVENTIYSETTWPADTFMASQLTYEGVPGHYQREQLKPAMYARTTRRYLPGQWYFMTHDQIHSIVFDKDAIVLVFEGDAKSDSSIILEPMVGDEVIPTFKVEEWMFKS